MKHNQLNVSFHMFDYNLMVDGNIWDGNLLSLINTDGLVMFDFHQGEAWKNRSVSYREWMKQWSLYSDLFTLVYEGNNLVEANGSLYQLNDKGCEYVAFLLKMNPNEVVLKKFKPLKRAGDTVVNSKVKGTDKVVRKVVEPVSERNVKAVQTNQINKLTMEVFSDVNLTVTCKSTEKESTIFNAPSPLRYQTTISLNNNTQLFLQGGFETVATSHTQQIDASCLLYSRVFNKSSINNEALNLGGRFYNTVTIMDKQRRGEMKINGFKLVELDFSCMQTRILYHMSGLDPQGDLYTMNGKLDYLCDRDTLKTATNILLNATGFNSAVMALACSMRCSDDIENGFTASDLLHQRAKLNRDKATQIIRDVSEAHTAISDSHFFRGVGLELQFVESQITHAVLTEMLSLGMPVLNIHDAFLVEPAYQTHAIRIIEKAYQRVLNTEFKPVVKVK